MVFDIIIYVKGYVSNLLSFKGMTFAQRKNMIVSDFENGYMEIDVALDCIDMLIELSL